MAPHTLHARSPLTPTTTGLLIALIALTTLTALLTLVLLLFRRRRNSQPAAPHLEKSSRRSSLFSLASSYSGSRDIDAEKTALMDADEKADAGVPQIRITFPDEVDASGRRTGGRQVVVTVGDGCVGLEPVSEGEAEAKRGFQSVDLERIGGLREAR